MTTSLKFSGSVIPTDATTNAERRSFIDDLAAQSVIYNPVLAIQCEGCHEFVEFTFREEDTRYPLFPVVSEPCPNPECEGYLIEWVTI